MDGTVGHNYDSAQNQTNAVVTKDNRLTTDGQGSFYSYDAEGRVTSYSNSVLIDAESGATLDVDVSFQWDQRGRLTQMVKQVTGSPTVTTKYVYDALDRLIGTQVVTGSTVTQSTTVVYDGQSQVAELDLTDGGKVVRNDLRGPDGQELLAVDQWTGSLPTTVWMFADPNGSVQTLATVNFQGNWQLKDRLFDATGTQGATFGDNSTALNLAPVIWNGAESADRFLSPYNNNALLGNLYELNGQWYASGLGRTLSQSNVTAGSTNPYVINGNDPFAKRSPGIDWSTIEGDNPEGLTWVDHSIRVVQVLTNVLNFGFSDWYTRRQLGNDVAGIYQQGAGYWVGTGLGIGVSLGLGGGAAGVTRVSAQAARLGVTARGLTTGLRAYALAGDVIGVGQSSYNLATGKFSALDTLGFLPTIGWGAATVRAIRKESWIATQLRQRTAADFARRLELGEIDGPAIAVAYDRTTGQFSSPYVNASDIAPLDDVLASRVQRVNKMYQDSEQRVVSGMHYSQPGTHAEVLAVNELLQQRRAAGLIVNDDLSNFVVNVIATLPSGLTIF